MLQVQCMRHEPSENKATAENKEEIQVPQEVTNYFLEIKGCEILFCQMSDHINAKDCQKTLTEGLSKFLLRHIAASRDDGEPRT